MIADFKLSPHFSFYNLTRTDHADLQEENRHCTAEEIVKLGVLAYLLESARACWGCEIDVHSARRYLVLNKRVGGSERSQHLKCEAADFSPAGPDTEASVKAAFDKLREAALGGRIKFGQLIQESDNRGREGRKLWVHFSLGAPYRDPARCGEVLVMQDGKYERLERIT